MDGSCSFPCLRRNIKELPWSLLITIFSSLPLRDLFRARAVCRYWNAVIASQELCGLWKPSDQDKCWVLSEVTYQKEGINPSAYAKQILSRRDDGSEEEEEEEEEELSKQWLEVWHPSSGVRTRLPIGGLLSLRPPFCSDATSNFKILASAEGLVCGTFSTSSGNIVYGCSYPSPRYALTVGNPFTHTWRTLPSVRNPPLLPVHTQACAVMWVDAHPSSAAHSRYRIALFPTASDYCTVLSRTCQRKFWLLVYDSKHDRWECAPHFNWSSSLRLTMTLPPCAVPFLFEPSIHDYEDSEGLGIGVYAMGSRSWNAVVEATLPMELDCHQWAYMAHRAFPYKGRCILIAVGVKCARNILVCTALELDVHGMAFKRLSKMSQVLSGKWHAYTSFCELSECPFRLVMEGMFVVIYPWIDEEVWPLMAFNMELSTWTRMQKYHPKYNYARSCTLSPSLTAVP